MNRMCVIIFAHKNKNDLLRLIERLKTHFDIYLHIDKKSSMKIEDSSENVHIYKIFKVVHGGVSQVTTTLFMLNEASKNNYERYIFISGQDIPIKSNSYIIDFFDNNKDKEFLTYKDVRSEEGLYNNISARMNNYNFGTLYRLLVNIKLRTAISNISYIKRELPENIYFGDSWFNITHKAVKYILEYVERNKKFLARMNYTWGSDEVFFQSILLTSPLKDNCVNNVYRYLVWQGGVPIVLKAKDFETLKKSKALFARKVDAKIDSEIIDKMYEYTK